MRSTPSCTSTCCANICRRPSYGQDCRNMSMVRSSLGPFPDEWILSGLDRILYFCGVKNVVELVDRIPGSSDCFLSSSYSESDECLSIPKQSKNRICQSFVQVDSKDKVVKARSVSIVTLAETEPDEKALGNSMNNLQRSVSLIQRSLESDNKSGTQSKSIFESFKRSLSEIRNRSGQTRLSEARKSKSNVELVKSDKEYNNGAQGNGKLETFYTSAEFKPLGPAPANKIDDCSNELFSSEAANTDCKQVAEISQICPSSPPNCNKREKYANLSPRHQQKLPRIIGTRWAMARINIFSDCSRTYEILEIKGRLPQAVIPCKTVVFFAVLPDGSTICYDYIKTKRR